MPKRIRSSAYASMPKFLPITPEGYPYIMLCAALALLTLLFGWLFAFALFFLAALFVCFFFRNPKREATADSAAVVAPADGKIIAIEGDFHPMLGGQSTKISTFMSILNCHVNRVPAGGCVEKVSYSPGKFFVANLSKASEHNEKNTIIMKDEKGRQLAVVQIAGVVARRIVCYLKEGVFAQKGARLGLIRFGSRVDLFLPNDGLKIEVKKGDRVRAGESVIGRWI